MNDQDARHFERSHFILYAIFRYRRDHNLEDVSEQIGLPYSTMRKYVAGVMACPVEVLQKIFAATRHPLLKELLEPEGYRLCAKDEQDRPLLPTVDAHLVDAFGKVTDIDRAFKAALEDGIISRAELEDIRVKKGRAEEALNQLLAKIREGAAK